jgi:hypothetical protein
MSKPGAGAVIAIGTTTIGTVVTGIPVGVTRITGIPVTHIIIQITIIQITILTTTRVTATTRAIAITPAIVIPPDVAGAIPTGVIGVRGAIAGVVGIATVRDQISVHDLVAQGRSASEISRWRCGLVCC